MNKTLFTLTLSSLVCFAGVAQAQDLDLDGGTTKKKKKEFKVKIDQEVKEVTKGLYAKSTVGGAAYVLSLGGSIYPGVVLGMGVGKDFYDTQNFSAAWEVNFLQGVHNGAYYEQQADAGCAQLGNCIQGDLRTFSLVGSAEASWYVAKRFGFDQHCDRFETANATIDTHDYENTTKFAKEISVVVQRKVRNQDTLFEPNQTIKRPKSKFLAVLCVTISPTVT